MEDAVTMPVRLLVVDDQETSRELLVKLLQPLGFEMRQAADGQAAIRVWQEHSGEIDLLFSDMVMPGGTTGLELAGRFRRRVTSSQCCSSVS